VITLSDGTAIAAWEEGNGIAASRRANGVWASPEIVSTNGSYPALAAGPGQVAHLVWSADDGTGNLEIYYSRWTNGTWGLSRNVSSTSGASAAPAIAVDEMGTIHVVWADTTGGHLAIYYARSSDGMRWATSPVPYAHGSIPAIAVQGDVVYVVWQEEDPITHLYDIWYAQGTGPTWSLPENVSYTPTNDGDSTGAAMALFATHPNIVWQEEDTGGSRTLLATERTSDGWLAPVAITPVGSVPLHPGLAVMSTTLYATWTSGGRIMFNMRTESWGTSSVALDAEAAAQNAYLIGGGSTLTVIWGHATEGDIYVSDYRQQLPLTRVLSIPIIHRDR